MAMLHVAVAPPERPAPRFFLSKIPIAVSVTTGDGLPVVDLEDRPEGFSGAFDIRRLSSPESNESQVVSAEPTATDLPGVYLVLLQPASGLPEFRWTTGDWRLGLRVRKGEHQGQTVFRMTIGEIG